jgi:hypothetical protein
MVLTMKQAPNTVQIGPMTANVTFPYRVRNATELHLVMNGEAEEISIDNSKFLRKLPVTFPLCQTSPILREHFF